MGGMGGRMAGRRRGRAATLPLRLLPSRTPLLHAAAFLPASTSLSFTAPAPRNWRIFAAAEEAPAPVEAEVEEVVEDAAVPELQGTPDTCPHVDRRR
ncbi:50S ribosomal protein L21, chloroplastic [Hordeum vulgare]|nr:50S ribosomal protein L21, chloroplastic [Hordeum vulgare]